MEAQWSERLSQKIPPTLVSSFSQRRLQVRTTRRGV